jgi:hypothetical protein
MFWPLERIIDAKTTPDRPIQGAFLVTSRRELPHRAIFWPEFAGCAVAAVSTVVNFGAAAKCFEPRGRRDWDRTSDHFHVKEVLYH